MQPELPAGSKPDSNPYGHTFYVIDKHPYPEDHPYNRHVIGSLEDLKITKSFLLKSNARAYEKTGAKLKILDNISKYGWSYDYLKERQQPVKNMTIPQIKHLAQKYLDANRIIWLMAGDAKTQMPRMKELGFEVFSITPKGFGSDSYRNLG